MAASSSGNHPLVTSLRDEVICTTCLCLPRVGMYQCENGHLICKDCIGRCSNVCPTCKKPMGKIRSIIADKILSLLPLPCRHSDHGCPAELYSAELSAHESSCPFRPVCCVDIACNAKVPFCRMVDHMSRDHESGDFVHAGGARYQSYFIVNDDDFGREIMWISDHLSLDGLHFFRECCRSAEGQWHVWVYLLGTPEEAAEYRATVRIFLPGTNSGSGGNSDDEEMLYRGKVNALNSPSRERACDVAGLTFPDFVARRFWRNKQIHYDVEVERRHPPPQSSGAAAATPTNTAPSSSSSSGKKEKKDKQSKSKGGGESSSKSGSAGSEGGGGGSEAAGGASSGATAGEEALGDNGRSEKTTKKKKTGGGSGSGGGKEKKDDVKETSC